MNISQGEQLNMEFLSVKMKQHPQWPQIEPIFNLLQSLDDDLDRIVEQVDFKSDQIDQLKPESQNQTSEVILHKKQEKDWSRYLNLEQNDFKRHDEIFDEIEVQEEITYTTRGNMKVKNHKGTFFVCKECFTIWDNNHSLGGHVERQHRMTK